MRIELLDQHEHEAVRDLSRRRGWSGRPAAGRRARPRTAARRRSCPTQAPPPISCCSPVLVGRHLGVGGDAERAEADLERLGERDHAAHDRQAQQRGGACVHETSGSEITSISPFAPSFESAPPAASCSADGLRTATAQVEMPRIITPSSTAWPPIGRVLGGLPQVSSSCPIVSAVSRYAPERPAQVSSLRVVGLRALRDGLSGSASSLTEARALGPADRERRAARRAPATRRVTVSTTSPSTVSRTGTSVAGRLARRS